MSDLDRRLQRVEAQADAAYWERVARVLTAQTGQPLTAQEARAAVEQAQRDVAPYLAQGLDPIAAYAALLAMTEREILAEAEAIAAALAS